MSDSATGEDTVTTRDSMSAPTTSAAAQTETPTQLGRYVVTERIGAGGMGVVYAAYDPQLDRKVAIKLLLPGVGGAREDERLLREAQAMAMLSHPNVVTVHDVGNHDGRIYVAMEFVAGQTLSAWLRLERRRSADILAMFVQAARGLQAAHDVGLVHRDFKPDNVLVDASGRAMVTDFGLARMNEAIELDDVTARTGPCEPTHVVTQLGRLVGTPAYMAPEQFEGAPSDARSDQFSWCVAAWEALYGGRPFTGTSIVELAVAVMRGQMGETTSTRKLPGWVRRVLRRGLAVERERRYPSLDALVGALDRGRGRARLRTGAVALGMIALVGAGAHLHTRAARRDEVASCERLGASVSSVWPGEDDGIRAAVRDRLLATKVSYAATTVANVQTWLDAYASAWRDATTQSCVHHRVELVWDDDLRSRADECLDERRSELAAIVDELARADAIVIQRAVTAAASLPRIEPCTDAAALARRPALPADANADVQRIRAELARAGALARAGRYAEGLAAVEPAVAEAAVLGWAPLVARARMALGSALETTGAYDAAERELVDAYMLARGSGASEIAEAAATTLVHVTGDRLAHHAEGMLWGRLAELEQTRSGGAPDRLALAERLVNLAAVHDGAAEYPEAKAMLERALEIRERTLGPDHPDVATTLGNLARVEQAMGANAEAERLLARTLAIHERALGSDHPLVASSLDQLAGLHHATGEPERARVLFERALAIREQALGSDHPLVASTLSNLGLVHHAMGSHSDARRLHERALAIRERTLGADHPDVAGSLDNLARVHRDTGDYATAKALHERALPIFEAALGPDHPEVAICLEALALVHSATGAHREAKALHERTLAIRETALGREHVDVGLSLANLGEVEGELGDFAQAQRLLARALAVFEKALGPDHSYVATTLMNLAMAERGAGEIARAKSHAERALAIALHIHPPSHPSVGNALFVRGEIGVDERDAEAIGWLERALAIRVENGAPAQELARVRAALARARARAK